MTKTAESAAPTGAAKANAATQPKDLTTFWVRKGRLTTLLNGIQTMQKRDDVSGKFARKLTQIGRVLREQLEALMDEEKALQELHKDKFPEGHARAGEVKPVYAQDEKGEPVYKTDAAGNKTEEREIVPGQFMFRDPVAYQTDRNDMLKEFIQIDVPCFRVTDPDGKDDKFVPELDRFQKVNGSAWDACSDFEEGSPCTVPPTSIDAAAPVVKAKTDAPVETDGDSRTAP